MAKKTTHFQDMASLGFTFEDAKPEGFDFGNHLNQPKSEPLETKLRREWHNDGVKQHTKNMKSAAYADNAKGEWSHRGYRIKRREGKPNANNEQLVYIVNTYSDGDNLPKMLQGDWTGVLRAMAAIDAYLDGQALHPHMTTINQFERTE